MKTFKDQAAQGDVLFVRVAEIPSDAVQQPKKSGPLVVAHSETGHNHQFGSPEGIEFYTSSDPMVCYLRIASPTHIEHMRPTDTHESIMFGAGCYQVRRQRERAYTPAGWRRVED